MGPATRCPEVFGQLETTVEATVDQQEWKNRSYCEDFPVQMLASGFPLYSVS